MQTQKNISEDKKAVITAYFKKQFGFFLAGVVLTMASVLALTLKAFLLEQLGRGGYLAITICTLCLAGLFFALTIISNLRMKSYLKRMEKDSPKLD